MHISVSLRQLWGIPAGLITNLTPETLLDPAGASTTTSKQDRGPHTMGAVYGVSQARRGLGAQAVGTAQGVATLRVGAVALPAGAHLRELRAEPGDVVA